MSRTLTRENFHSKLSDYFIMLFGCVIYAAALVVFIKPINIPIGGFSGVSLAINHLFSIPIGVMTIILNLPLFIVSYRSFGSSFIFKTLFATIVTSVFTDLFDMFIPKFSGDLLIAFFYGGIGMGAGLGLIIARGGTLGGTEILSKFVNRKTGISMGSSNLALCTATILIASVAYGKLESVLYAIIIEFIISRTMDVVIYGLDESVGIFIITSKPKEISDAVINIMDRGVTAINGTGMYTQNERSVLICAVRKNESAEMKEIISRIGSMAFVLFTDIKEIYGNGFKKYER